MSDRLDAVIRELAAALQEEMRAEAQPAAADRLPSINPVAKPDRSPRASGTAVRTDALDGAG